MRKWLTVLLLFVNLLVQAQGISEAEESLQARAMMRGVDLDSLVDSAMREGFSTRYKGAGYLDSLRYTSTLGQTRWIAHRVDGAWHYDMHIDLRPGLTEDFNLLETTVAHEKAHLLNIGHCHLSCESIMSEITKSIVEYTEEYKRVFYSPYREERWDEYFNLIKSKYDIE